MYRKKQKGWMKHADFLLINQLCLHISFVIAYCLRHGWSRLPYDVEIYRNMALVMSGVDLLVTILFNTLHNVLKRGYYLEAACVVKHTLLVFMTMVFYLFSIKLGFQYSRFTVYATMVLYTISNYTARMAWKKFLFEHPKPKDRLMLIVTNKDMAEEIIRDLRADINQGIEIAGLTILDADLCGTSIAGIPVVAAEQDTAAYICREWIDEVLIYLPLTEPKPALLMEQCREMGVTIHVSLNDHGLQKNQQFVETLSGHMVLVNSINSATPLQAFLKRMMDIAGGLAGCILAGIALLIVGPMIYIQSPGPVIFSQERMGLNGRKFKLYKIRSMHMDAEKHKAELMKENRVGDGMMFKLDFDPRIIGNQLFSDGTRKTGIGEWIRKYSVDELPQFWNVLKGDMSLVGTRPPTVDEWEKYKLHHRARLSIKPGITGMWQVNGRSNITDFEHVVKLDTEYIRNWSMGLDCRILLKTIYAVFKQDGAM